MSEVETKIPVEDFRADDIDTPGKRSFFSTRNIWLIVILFIVLENIVVPPRYQLSNNIALGAIWAYQGTVSKLFRNTGAVRCRYYPSCSEYGRLSYAHYGFLQGIARSTWRILRCNPFNRGPHEEWPYEGAWEDCKRLPHPGLELPPDVHLPSWAKDEMAGDEQVEATSESIPRN